MGAFIGASKYLKKPLCHYAKQFEYDEDNVLILKNDESSLKEKYPETYSNISSCKHHADKRTAMEYAKDLVASWIIEDYFLELMDSKEFSITLNGADSNRKILKSTETSSSSDYLISYKGIKIEFELMVDYDGFWKKNHVLHLRDLKYEKLKSSKSLFIAVSTLTNEFALFDFREEIPARYIKNHNPFGGKPAYEIKISNEMLTPIDKNTIEKSIISHLNERKSVL